MNSNYLAKFFFFKLPLIQKKLSENTFANVLDDSMDLGCFEIQLELVDTFRAIHFHPTGELYLEFKPDHSSSECKVTLMCKFIKYHSHVLHYFMKCQDRGGIAY